MWLTLSNSPSLFCDMLFNLTVSESMYYLIWELILVFTSLPYHASDGRCSESFFTNRIYLVRIFYPRTSLVAQWLESGCHCRGYGFNPWSGSITCCGEAHMAQLLTPCSRAFKPQLLSQPHHRACVPQEKPPREKSAQHPNSRQLEKAPGAAVKTQPRQKGRTFLSHETYSVLLLLLLIFWQNFDVNADLKQREATVWEKESRNFLMLLLKGYKSTLRDMKGMCGIKKYVSDQQLAGSNAASIICCEALSNLRNVFLYMK